MVAEKPRGQNLMVREESYFYVKCRNFTWSIGCDVVRDCEPATFLRTTAVDER
jgi:hypothetical protein